MTFYTFWLCNYKKPRAFYLCPPTYPKSCWGYKSAGQSLMMMKMMIMMMRVVVVMMLMMVGVMVGHRCATTHSAGLRPLSQLTPMVFSLCRWCSSPHKYGCDEYQPKYWDDNMNVLRLRCPRPRPYTCRWWRRTVEA